MLVRVRLFRIFAHFQSSIVPGKPYMCGALWEYASITALSPIISCASACTFVPGGLNGTGRMCYYTVGSAHNRRRRRRHVPRIWVNDGECRTAYKSVRVRERERESLAQPNAECVLAHPFCGVLWLWQLLLLLLLRALTATHTGWSE